MPAAEQTWRDTKLLHKVFGVSSFVMLVATIWMFAADHNREWKPIQHTSDTIEIKMTAWREQQYNTEDAKRQKEALEAAVVAARRRPIPPALLEQFKVQVGEDPSKKDVSLASIQQLASEIESN